MKSVPSRVLFVVVSIAMTVALSTEVAAQGYPPPPPPGQPPGGAGPGTPGTNQQPLRREAGLEVVTSIGLNTLGGTAGSGEGEFDIGDNYGTGLHLGLSIGSRNGQQFSIHGEFTIDVINADIAEQFDSYSNVIAGMAVAPYFHTGNANMDFVIGAKLGIFADVVSAEVDGFEVSGSGTGFIYGLNMGLLFRVGQGYTHLGPLLSYQAYSYGEFCSTVDGVEDCQDVPDDYNQSMTTLSLAAWF